MKKRPSTLRVVAVFVLGLIGISLLALSPAFLGKASANGGERPGPNGRKSGPVALTSSSQVDLTGETSPDGVWESVSDQRMTAKLEAQDIEGSARIRNVRLNRESLVSILDRAPVEVSGVASGVILTLPLPHGGFGRFRVEDSPIMEAELAAKFPEIKTYSAKGIDDPTASARFSWTPNGLSAVILSADGASFIEPATPGSQDYLNYFGNEVGAENSRFACAVDTLKPESSDQNATSAITLDETQALAPTTGATLRTYRLAVAATAEFTQYYGNGDKAAALTKITEIINGVNAVYQRDVAIKLVLIARELDIIFTDAAGDGYTNDTVNADPQPMLSQNQTKLDTVIGSANYDIGHVFGALTSVGPNAFQFSGIASLRVVCQNGAKARGATLMGGTHPVFDNALVGGVAHEFGHQFDADHTFNATLGGCGDQRSGANAVEPGSGSTIMAYTTCTDGTNTEVLQRFTDLYFHARSIEQITTYAATQTCQTGSATGNSPPVIVAPLQPYNIPANTPFALTVSATDGNGDALTYAWEEYDGAGAHSGPPNTDDGVRPIFRSYKPVSSPTRYFPSLTYILNNANIPPLTYQDNIPGFTPKTFLVGESLPTTNRTMNFSITVRDNHAPTGGIETWGTQVNVKSAAGPFNLTQPNTSGVSWQGGSQQKITWNVAGTNGGEINAANVKISLSMDGGNTFPIVLAGSTANDGSETLLLPTITTSSTQARVKVEAVGNIFFDISNANFTVTPGTAPACTYQLSATSVNMPSVGGGTSVNVTTVAGCAWTATSNASFITVTGGSPGSGNGTINLDVLPNAGAQRSGMITIAGQTFTVNQAAWATPTATTAAVYMSRGDFDGDGRADLAVWRPASGAWFIMQSSNNQGSGRGWGTAEDIPVPADYDGDGKTDLAVWRPSSGAWFIVSSSTGQGGGRGWGSAGDIPVPADYDGDGKADLAVWRPSSGAWFIMSSSTNQGSGRGWGTAGDIPVPGDYDGDGKADLAVWRPSSGAWYIINSSTNQGSGQSLGAPGDIPVPGKYDSDNKTDIAIYKPSSGAWFVVQSSNSQTSANGWGSPIDIPVPADYDGDGKTDNAVWRPETGEWSIKKSSDNSKRSLGWGSQGDIPVSSSMSFK